MSFTSNIKTEISNIEYNKAENITELSAFLNISGNFNKNEILLYIENISVARRIYKLIKSVFNIEVSLTKEERKRLNKTYVMVLKIKDKVPEILNTLDLIENNKRKYVPGEYLYNEEELLTAYIRGAFFACGSINDPKTARYHAEFIINQKETAEFINNSLIKKDLKSKVLKRDNSYMVYIKEAERISDLIKMLNSYNSLFYFEDIRIYRDHKNMSNRLNNCEQANIEKIIFSSNEQLNNIKKLKERPDFDLLDEKIKQVCIYKEKYPESSMEELANIISKETNKKITKSCVNHRFRKIKELANS